jgi:hypothetical protein
MRKYTKKRADELWESLVDFTKIKKGGVEIDQLFIWFDDAGKIKRRNNTTYNF